MTPERYQQIQSLYLAAQELEANQRVEYLARACGTDSGLRQEVEELLRYADETGALLNGNALEIAARQIAAANLSEIKSLSLAGQQLGGYEVLAPIGKGGMGEVYLARDSRLDRKVALKLLPAALMQDAQRVRRFTQEAKAASALNHPNILTIYEFSTATTDAGATRFLVSEFIDGETLRDRLRRDPLSLNEAVDIAAQTAQALAAAHEANIVHRDIKPENVMLRKDGIVKVLDFGLAKLTETQNAERRTRNEEENNSSEIHHSSFLLHHSTMPGTVIGTVAYMSPEQARGNPVDARTDLFSLGVMLYEMLARRRPFTGETVNHVIVAILEKDPPPLTRVPIEILQILEKSLAKQADERYDSAQAMLADLKKLQMRLLVDAENQRLSADDAPVEAQMLVSPQTAVTAPDVLATASISEKLTSADKAKPLKRWLAAGLSLLLVVGGYFGYGYFTATRQIESVAVMPFVNVSGNADVEYLSDGIAETLISSLSQLPRLKVKARNAVYRYKGQTADPQAIGRELGVRAVLIGRVTQSGDSLAISVELIDVNDNNQLWGERYDRRINDLLQTHQDIATHITDKLRLKLTGAEQQLLAKRPTSDPEAYRLYLKGRWHANRLTREDLEKSLQYFQQAVARDDKYALAHQGLAYYYMQAVDITLSPRDAMPKLREMSAKALSLDDTLAEAHFTMAMYLWQYEWNWEAAEKEYKRALSLNPNHADALGSYGLMLVELGRTEEGLALGRQYLELISMLGEPDFYYASGLLFARRYDEFFAAAKEALARDPNFWLMHTHVGRAYEVSGRFTEAIAAYEKARAIDPSIPELLGELGRCYARAGRKAEAEKILRQLIESAQHGYVPPYCIAMIYLGLDDKDRAFAWLEKAYQDRSWYLTWLTVVPWLDNIRADARFVDLQRRVVVLR